MPLKRLKQLNCSYLPDNTKQINASSNVAEIIVFPTTTSMADYDKCLKEKKRKTNI